MKILALELSTARGSLAWLDSDSTNTEVVTWPNDRKDSGPFFDHLQRAIREFGLPGKIIVGFGPGSYAGVRIAISAAIGLQAAATSELVGYPSVCAMETSDEDYVVIGDARRKSFFFVTIRARNVAGDYELLDESALQDRLRKIGPGFSIMSSDLLPQFRTVEQRFPSAEVLARLAADPGRKFSVPPLEPIYLREANVTIPKPIFKS
jgi:tRNA threonylcarbamoyladenosine biosynthesis protein TsaB